jgi:DNA polymerase III subunit epsilon
MEFLQDKPAFSAIADDFLQFIDGAELIIHNAPFDVGFLNSELGKIGKQSITQYCGNIIDTLKMAKNSRPGQRNNLDALCRHFGIDNSKRTLHGALLDAELLAEVYMAMTRGQESLMMDLSQTPTRIVLDNTLVEAPLIIKRANDAELQAHHDYLAGLEKSGKLVWKH